jgi:hypothetical protein
VILNSARAGNTGVHDTFVSSILASRSASFSIAPSYFRSVRVNVRTVARSKLSINIRGVAFICFFCDSFVIVQPKAKDGI